MVSASTVGIESRASLKVSGDTTVVSVKGTPRAIESSSIILDSPIGITVPAGGTNSNGNIWNADLTAATEVTLKNTGGIVPVSDPTLSPSTANASVKAGEQYQGSPFMVSGGTAPYTWGATCTELPSLICDTSNGAITVTPTTAENYTINVTVTDNNGKTANAELTLTVTLPQPLIKKDDFTKEGSKYKFKTSAVLNKPFSYTFKVSGAEPVKWSASGLPNSTETGSIDLETSTGILAGTLKKAQNYEFTVTATGADGQKDEITVVLAAENGAPPSIRKDDFTKEGSKYKFKNSAVLNKPFSYMFKASGTDTVTWSATGLPNSAETGSLTLNSATGALSGTLKKAHTYEFTVTATGADEQTETINVVLVAERGAPPTIKKDDFTKEGSKYKFKNSAVLNKPFSYMFKASGTDTVTWSASGLPNSTETGSLDLGASTGVLAGTLKKAQNYEFTVTATGADGQKDEITVVLVAEKATTEGTVLVSTATGNSISTVSSKSTSNDVYDLDDYANEYHLIPGKDTKIELEADMMKETDTSSQKNSVEAALSKKYQGFGTNDLKKNYLTLDINKYTKDVSEPSFKSTPDGKINDTTKPIEITLTVSGLKQKNMSVYRYHGTPQPFTQIISGGRPKKGSYKDETYYVDGETVYLYTSKFSTYLIAYPTVESWTVQFDSKGGSDVDSIIVADKGKISAPTTPTRSGYTFQGWYMDEAMTRPWSADTTFSSNTTLYANWTRVSSGTNNPSTANSGSGSTSGSTSGNTSGNTSGYSGGVNPNDLRRVDSPQTSRPFDPVGLLMAMIVISSITIVTNETIVKYKKRH